MPWLDLESEIAAEFNGFSRRDEEIEAALAQRRSRHRAAEQERRRFQPKTPKKPRVVDSERQLVAARKGGAATKRKRWASSWMRFLDADPLGV